MPEKGAFSGVPSCYRYHFALVSRISNSFERESSFPLKSGAQIDIDKARREHEELVEILRKIGLDVIELPSDEKHPDGTFVDDIAVVINGTALICNPPSFKDRPSRQGELAVVRQVLRKELGLKIVEVDSSEAVVEGGNVLWTGREIFVGLNERTNVLGAQAVAKAFPEYPTTTVHVDKQYVHLKDYISLAGPEVLVISKSDAAKKTFKEMQEAGGPGYKYLEVDEDEAANVIFCNGTMVHLAYDQIVESAKTFANKIDYPRVGIHMEEVLKRGGRLSSCVLLVHRSRHQKNILSSLP